MIFHRALVRRVEYLEKQIGSREANPEFFEGLEESVVYLLREHDWEHEEAEDFQRRHFGQIQRQNILRLIAMLPLDRALDLWQQYAPSKPPAPLDPEANPFSKMTSKALIRAITPKDDE